MIVVIRFVEICFSLLDTSDFETETPPSRNLAVFQIRIFLVYSTLRSLGFFFKKTGFQLFFEKKEIKSKFFFCKTGEV